MDCNPNLSAWTWPTDVVDPAGEKSIEHPARIENMIWQNRAALPTAYEDALGNALEEVFAAGAVELDEVIAKLNELGFPSPEQGKWTEEIFLREMKQLGA
jgi:hypothetical protein